VFRGSVEVEVNPPRSWKILMNVIPSCSKPRWNIRVVGQTKIVSTSQQASITPTSGSFGIIQDNTSVDNEVMDVSFEKETTTNIIEVSSARVFLLFTGA